MKKLIKLVKYIWQETWDRLEFTETTITENLLYEIQKYNDNHLVSPIRMYEAKDEKTEKVKSVQKEKIKSLKALKASIFDRAFRGDL